MIFSCPQCGQAIDADDSVASQVVTCPSCSKELTAPSIQEYYMAESQVPPLQQPLQQPNFPAKNIKRVNWVATLSFIFLSLLFLGITVFFVFDLELPNTTSKVPDYGLTTEYCEVRIVPVGGGRLIRGRVLEITPDGIRLDSIPNRTPIFVPHSSIATLTEVTRELWIKEMKSWD